MLFSTLGVNSSYHIITVAEDSRNYTAFQQSMANMNLFEFPLVYTYTQVYVYTMMIIETLKALGSYFAYLDDIIIYSKSEKEHLDDIWQVFYCFCKANIMLKLIKCDFLKAQIHYIGHLLS